MNLMHDLTDNSLGRIYILSDFNSNTGIFGTKKIYLDHLRNPNSVAFYKDGQGITWLYVALTDKLVRYQYEPGEDAPSHEPQTIATFPGYGLSYKYGGWHLTRTVVTHNDKIYVAVGSSCNSCEEKIDEVRAEIIVMDPDGANEHVFAKGLRNAVGIKWVNDNFYATNMGVDHLGPTVPNEMFYQLKANTDYGWPYCYVKDGKIYGDSTVAWKRTPTDCTRVPPPDAYFEAHEAPLGFEYFDSTFADQKLHDLFLVVLHGARILRLEAVQKLFRYKRMGQFRIL
jgi:glucose/arabinose dehydrogenase